MRGVYAKLEQLKNGKSFSELIDELIRANVSLRIEKLLELSRYETGREDELASIVSRP
ncbi:MAG: hypothetical protein NXY59_05315 [Aigarchaeota archaeon]|nr:hypothetical protein [Candidatus Pelearchaeum maunauluense]